MPNSEERVCGFLPLWVPMWLGRDANRWWQTGQHCGSRSLLHCTQRTSMSAGELTSHSLTDAVPLIAMLLPAISLLVHTVLSPVSNSLCLMASAHSRDASTPEVVPLSSSDALLKLTSPVCFPLLAGMLSSQSLPRPVTSEDVSAPHVFPSNSKPLSATETLLVLLPPLYSSLLTPLVLLQLLPLTCPAASLTALFSGSAVQVTAWDDFMSAVITLFGSGAM